ncbi:hypothetical protein BGZ97_002535 [Linnemannia gamsii]|uniref:Uncharacterized protein n=1 Tax=Linnemannia gamsii TaxID=64522 RepID=A0A9P6QUI0_9FUNG|nr:hypothetical protein BGZ97_002535 [Linnemannia gamsii]
MSTRNAMDTGADGKTPAAPPPSPFSFFLSQQGESDSVVVPFNEMSSLGKAYLRTYCCCSPKTSSTATATATATAGAAPSSSSSSAKTAASSTVYPSPELSDLGDDDIAALEGIVLDVDNSYTSHKLRRRPSLDFNQNRIKRFRPSPPSPRLSQTTFNNCDEDDLTVVSDTVTDDTVSSNPAPSNFTFASSTSDLINPIVVESPPYHPADVFPDSNSGWHEQIIEYDWASSTDEDERRTAFSDSYWSGIDCRDETFSELETRFGLDGMDSPPYQPQDYNEMNPTMDPQETRWFEQQLTTLSSGSRRRREDSPPYVPFDYNTLSSEMDPNEDRFFEQSHTKYVSTTADEDCSDSASCDGDVSSNDMSISDDDMCPSDDDF